MQHSDMNSPYYQYYQSQFQNPNPNQPDPQFNVNPLPTPSYASAPPASDYSPAYPSYSQNPPDHALPTNPPSNPNPSSTLPHQQHQPYYSFPHLASQPTPPPPPYYSYDQNQTALNSDNPNPNYYSASPDSSYPYGSSSVSNYENLDDNSGNFGKHGAQGYDQGGFGSDMGGGSGSGVYQYNGGKTEPYGARGSRSQSSAGGGLVFDDYGRAINTSKVQEPNISATFPKIVKAVPMTDTQQDAKSGVQKYRVKLLSEGIGQADMDVLCQIGLDGFRILDPVSSRILKIYPLEIVTRWEILDTYIFAFWATSSIDVDPRRIRLKSNSYTAKNILDTVTAASFQLKEMGGSAKPSDSSKTADQPLEKKKGFADWMNMMKPANEEKDHWVPDEAVTKCTACGTDFGAFVRRHHCRNCGDIFCDKCTQGRIALTADQNAQPVRVCDRCMAEVTQRLSHAKEVAGRVSELQSHEDLAKKLQAEMEKNRKTSAGLKSDGAGMRMREVECPTCTVHLQVQLPSSGSETIECSVCQHPFLVGAN